MKIIEIIRLELKLELKILFKKFLCWIRIQKLVLQRKKLDSSIVELINNKNEAKRYGDMKLHDRFDKLINLGYLYIDQLNSSISCYQKLLKQ